MINLKNVLLALTVSMFFSFSAIASEVSNSMEAEVETQTLELEAADVSVLRLSSVENEANKNSSEIHQEASVGRAGLQGLCKCWFDAQGNLLYCQ